LHDQFDAIHDTLAGEDAFVVGLILVGKVSRAKIVIGLAENLVQFCMRNRIVYNARDRL
jgi:hypothetical protein